MEQVILKVCDLIETYASVDGVVFTNGTLFSNISDIIHYHKMAIKDLPDLIRDKIKDGKIHIVIDRNQRAVAITDQGEFVEDQVKGLFIRWGLISRQY